MSSTIEQGNPLLKIDTSFQSYLILHSLTSKIMDDDYNYVYESDSSIRQSINGVSGWNKVYKSITTRDMPAIMKTTISSAVAVDAWNNAEIYDMATICAERLKTRLPSIVINTKDKTCRCYSICSEDIDPCIVLTPSFISFCTRDEMMFVLATEISRTQNGHCIYMFTAPYVGLSEDTDERRKNFMRIEGISAQVKYLMNEWPVGANTTTDRAALICLDNPEKFPEVFKSVMEKNLCNYIQPYEVEETLDLADITEYSKLLRRTAARSIMIDEKYGMSARRILCAMEFFNCEIFYNCRADITAPHTVSKQMADLRCDIILGTAKGDD